MNIFRLIAILILFIYSCSSAPEFEEREEQSGAGQALESWVNARFAGDQTYNANSLLTAYNSTKQHNRGLDRAKWTSLGPKNIGGRTLCLAFHPTDPNVIYAGSASGGLWKTSSSGIGYHGWVQVPINLPVYSVASILIDPKNPNTIYLGTGEVYNKSHSMPGIVDRFTRGTYGMGIIKTEDGGLTWKQILPLTQNIISGVQDLEFDPYDNHIIYAATTEGLFKTTNQGAHWSLIHNVPMAVDVDVNPVNPEIIYVTHGSYDDNNISGIFRSNNSGNSFIKLQNGLPNSYSGKAKLAISKSNPDILFASVANAESSLGLFMSVDAGNSWDKMSSSDVANVQGWYSHDIAIHPTNPNFLSYVGQNAYISDARGSNFINVSSWDAGDMGRVPVGGSEGINIYIHADIHATYFHPSRNNEIYFATDGGIFMSPDLGANFEGRNGGYQTSQFYANFSASKSDSKFAIGGMQDNGTAIYDGQDGWIKVIGGDGMSTAINTSNENIIYGTYQYFGLSRSLDKGKTFEMLRPLNNAFVSEAKSFNTPFEVVAALPNTIYAGAQKVYINENNGNPANWRALHSTPLESHSTILALGVSSLDPSLMLASTVSPDDMAPPKLFRSTNGGSSWTQVPGLPAKAAMDISFDPQNSQTVYVVFSGFGYGTHVYKSTDAGSSWKNIDNGLPDVPTNCITINPKQNKELYLGNDLGVFLSTDGGLSWERFMQGLPEAVMAMSIHISAQADLIKVATHGNGVYESPLAISIPTKEIENQNIKNFVISPNPATSYVRATISLTSSADLHLDIIDLQGRTVQSIRRNQILPGNQSIELQLSNISPGIYTVVLKGQILGDDSSFYLSRKLVKK